MAPGSNSARRMHIERVDCSPSRDVYHPGDVINSAIYFEEPFIGQCEVGLVRKDHPWDDDFERNTFAKSSDVLYEGQLYLRESQIGRCVLRARLAPVKGEAVTVAVGDQIFEVRPLMPGRSPR